MNEAIPTVVMVLYSVFDQRGNATNSGAFKWPNNGFRILWVNGWFHVEKGFNGREMRLGPPDNSRVLITRDLWHNFKHLRFYLPPAYILTLTLWPSLLPQWWGFIPATALATIAWKVLPQPEHWKGN